VPHRAPQAEIQPAEPTAGDLPQPELSPRARAALSAIVRLLARQTAEKDFRSQGGNDMTDRTATPHGNRPHIEQIAALTGTPAQQICKWITAHKLEACRDCNGFRIEELGLADLLSSPESDRSHRRRRTDGSGPSFASAGTWRS
jgi:hypothetical protein